MGLVNTFANSWTPIVASGNGTCGECLGDGITETEFIRRVLDRHSIEMGRLVGAKLLWAS